MEPLGGALGSFAPVRLEVVSQSPLESLWDELVRAHHYLGYRKLLGHRLKYLAFAGDRPVAALSWSGAARKLRVRDCVVGWSDAQRKAHLQHVVEHFADMDGFDWVLDNLNTHWSLDVCRLVAELCDVPFVERDLSRDPQAASEMVQISGQQGVPVTVIDGQVVLAYEKPQLDENDADAQRLLGGGVMLSSGTISLQSESHGIEFRRIEIRPLD